MDFPTSSDADASSSSTQSNTRTSNGENSSSIGTINEHVAPEQSHFPLLELNNDILLQILDIAPSDTFLNLASSSKSLYQLSQLLTTKRQSIRGFTGRYRSVSIGFGENEMHPLQMIDVCLRNQRDKDLIQEIEFVVSGFAYYRANQDQDLEKNLGLDMNDLEASLMQYVKKIFRGNSSDEQERLVSAGLRTDRFDSSSFILLALCEGVETLKLHCSSYEFIYGLNQIIEFSILNRASTQPRRFPGDTFLFRLRRLEINGHACSTAAKSPILLILSLKELHCARMSENVEQDVFGMVLGTTRYSPTTDHLSSSIESVSFTDFRNPNPFRVGAFVRRLPKLKRLSFTFLEEGDGDLNDFDDKEGEENNSGGCVRRRSFTPTSRQVRSNFARILARLLRTWFGRGRWLICIETTTRMNGDDGGERSQRTLIATRQEDN